MSSSWIILILLVIALVIYLFGRKYKLSIHLGDLFRGHGSPSVEELEAATKEEKERAAELAKLLAAKKELYAAKSASRKLIKEIELVSDANPDGGAKVVDKGTDKTKVKRRLG